MNCPHCETEIDEHEANGCLDAWVAEAVMDELVLISPSPIYVGRFHWTRKGEWYSVTDGPKAVPEYSTDIAAAWELMGHWNDGDEKHSNVAWNITKPGLDDYWSCAFWGDLDHYKRYIGWGNSASLAICRAALKATIKEFA